MEGQHEMVFSDSANEGSRSIDPCTTDLHVCGTAKAQSFGGSAILYGSAILGFGCLGLILPGLV